MAAETTREAAIAFHRPQPLANTSLPTKSTLVPVGDACGNLVYLLVVYSSGGARQPVENAMAMLAARRKDASINAAAKASGINYRTARRIGGCRRMPATP